MIKRTILFVSCLGLLVFACQRQGDYTADAEVIARGQQLFEIQCSSCHNFRSTEIGPNLAGVTTETSPDWLKSFIKNPVALIESGDERAVQTFQEFKTYMPAFATISDEDLDAILAYMHTKQEKRDIQATADLGPAIENPILDTIPLSDVVLSLKLVATAPPTAEKSPVARINKMVPLSDSSGRQFISDLNGILYELKDGKFLPFLKMTDHFEHFINQPGLATGLGSFAFHPDYAENGLFYTNHTEDPETSAPADFAYSDTIPRKVRWVVMEWKQNDPAASSFSGSKRELFRIDMVTQIHGMQELTFNPSTQTGDEDYGLLYIGIGDGGSSQNGFWHLVQNKNQPWGNILRIDPAGRNSANGKYGIPTDNPFVGEMEAGALGEIYAMGYRNPHRFLWDTEGDGNMMASDIGHRQIEELNIIEKGRNYGWPEREGTFRSHKESNLDFVYALPKDDASKGFTYPALQFDHDEAGAISSGYVYYGKEIPELRGKYFFGGIVNGRVFCVDAAALQLGQQAPFEEVQVRLGNGPLTTFRDLTNNKRVDLRFGYDAAGELYIFTKADGKIYQLVGVNRPVM